MVSASLAVLATAASASLAAAHVHGPSTGGSGIALNQRDLGLVQDLEVRDASRTRPRYSKRNLNELVARGRNSGGNHGSRNGPKNHFLNPVVYRRDVDAMTALLARQPAPESGSHALAQRSLLERRNADAEAAAAANPGGFGRGLKAAAKAIGRHGPEWIGAGAEVQSALNRRSAVPEPFADAEAEAEAEAEAKLGAALKSVAKSIGRHGPEWIGAGAEAKEALNKRDALAEAAAAAKKSGGLGRAVKSFGRAVGEHGPEWIHAGAEAKEAFSKRDVPSSRQTLVARSASPWALPDADAMALALAEADADALADPNLINHVIGKAFKYGKKGLEAAGLFGGGNSNGQQRRSIEDDMF